MIKQCTQEFLAELGLKAQEGKIESLVIEIKDDKYYADYTYSEESIQLNLSSKLHVASVIKDFASMLAIDKVNSFSIHYEAEGDSCIISQSYKMTPEDITNDTKLEQCQLKLVDTLVLLKEIGLDQKTVTEVFEKATKQTVNEKVVQKQNMNNKIRYQEITLDSAINKILEVIR